MNVTAFHLAYQHPEVENLLKSYSKMYALEVERRGEIGDGVDTGCGSEGDEEESDLSGGYGDSESGEQGRGPGEECEGESSEESHGVGEGEEFGSGGSQEGGTGPDNVENEGKDACLEPEDGAGRVDDGVVLSR